MSYIEPTEDPLSANAVLAKGAHFLWAFDVGNNPEGANIINSKGLELKVILSHFHPDHIGNLSLLSPLEIYQGKNTFGYTHSGEIVDELTEITDGDLNIKLIPMPSSHAKGSLAALINNEYLLLGDSTYTGYKAGKGVIYNTSLLGEMLKILKGIDAPFFLRSHHEPFVESKAFVIKELEEIYNKRVSGEPYIVIKEQ